MAWDIHGNYLRPGYCEVHPHVQQEYPCEICLTEIREEERRRQLAETPTERLYTKEEVTCLILEAISDTIYTLHNKEIMNSSKWLNEHL